MKIKAENAKQFIQHCETLVKMWEGGEPAEGEHAVFHRGLKMYEQLRRLELKANRDQCADCNGELTEEQAEKRDDATRARLKKIFGGVIPDGVFINGDPRGYTLKVKEAAKVEGMYSDWGGYGILAPEF